MMPTKVRPVAVDAACPASAITKASAGFGRSHMRRAIHAVAAAPAKSAPVLLTAVWPESLCWARKPTATRQSNREKIRAGLIIRSPARASPTPDWQRKASLTTAGGLVFMGSGGDCALHAYDKDTDKVLWEKPVEANPDGIPAVYEAGGRPVVVFYAAAMGVRGSRTPMNTTP